MAASRFSISAWPSCESRWRAAATRHGTLTQTDSTESVILGTAGYMSPEQVRGQAPDHRSDIFSFGAMFYEMVSGQRAFGATARSTMSAILKHDPPLLGATTRRSRRRWQRHSACSREGARSAVSVRTGSSVALGRLAGTSSSGATILLPARSGWRRWGGMFAERLRGRDRWPPSTWGVWVAAVTLLLALSVGGGLLWFRAGTDPLPIESLVVLSLANLTGNPEQDYFAEGLTEALGAPLSQVQSLRVISGQSASRYKKRQVSGSKSQEIWMSMRCSRARSFGVAVACGSPSPRRRPD